MATPGAVQPGSLVPRLSPHVNKKWKGKGSCFHLWQLETHVTSNEGLWTWGKTNFDHWYHTHKCRRQSDNLWLSPESPPFTFRPCSQEMLSHIGEYLTTGCNASKFMLIGCKCKWESLFWKNHYTTKYSERCMSLYRCWLSQFWFLQTPFIWISDYMKAIEHHLLGDNETKLLRSLGKPSVATLVGYVRSGCSCASHVRICIRYYK